MLERQHLDTVNNRMGLLRGIDGPIFEEVREEFLGGLMHADHTAVAKVYSCAANNERVQRGEAG